MRLKFETSSIYIYRIRLFKKRRIPIKGAGAFHLAFALLEALVAASPYASELT
jgi:hypothetical protein